MPAPRLEVSEAKKRLIMEGYVCGDSLAELRLRAGVSVTVVRRILLEMGLMLRPRGRPKKQA